MPLLPNSERNVRSTLTYLLRELKIKGQENNKKGEIK